MEWIPSHGNFSSSCFVAVHCKKLFIYSFLLTTDLSTFSFLSSHTHTPCSLSVKVALGDLPEAVSSGWNHRALTHSDPDPEAAACDQKRAEL